MQYACSICSEKLIHINSAHKEIDFYCSCIKVQAASKTAPLQNNVHDNQDTSTEATVDPPEDFGSRVNFKAGDKVLGFWAEERIWRKAAVIQISQV